MARLKENADRWTIRLAELCSTKLGSEVRATALQLLADTFETGLAEVDQTRRRILELLARLDDLGQPTATMETETLRRSDMQARRPLPVLQPGGLDGVSLVAVHLAPARISESAVRNWVTLAVEEIVLVDGMSDPALAQRLRDAGIDDPRLVIIRLDDVALTWTRAINIGLRASRYARIWAISSNNRLNTGHLLDSLPEGTYAAATSQAESGGFILGTHRGDLAAAGGFSEYLETADWAVEDLAGRLAALSVQRRALPLGLAARGPLPPRTDKPADAVSLRDSLCLEDDFAALQNRFIAMAMPDWMGSAQVPCRFGPSDERGQHVQLVASAVSGVPLHIKTTSETHVLIEKLRMRLGGTPERLSRRQLAMVLAGPSKDVSVLDIAVAGPARPG